MEASTTPTSTNGTHKENSSLMERTQIENTPFYIWADYRGEKPKHYITLGDFKVSEDYDYPETAHSIMKPGNPKYWEFIMSVMVAVIQKTQEVQRISKEIPEE